MGKDIKILGTLVESKKLVADRFLEKLQESFPDITAEVYLGYPIYIDEISSRRVCVDIALISKIGVFIINILENAVTDYSLLQDEIYSKIEWKFKKQNFLVKRKRLLFKFHTITYSQAGIQEQEECPLAHNIEELLAIIIKLKADEEYSDDLYNKILSGLQEAYGINIHNIREGIREGTKAYAINEMNFLVEKYGNSQMEAILSDTEGIQRIRGMAGSGKTIVLARKAVELHTAHPEWDIVVTYYTRSLKQQLENLISRFYAIKNDGAKYNNEKLRIMQAWGSKSSNGIYYEACIAHRISPLSYNEAKTIYQGNVFASMCRDLLDNVDKFEKLYDCILIDEAQDFDKNFLKLCSKLVGEKRRLVYAYDELQSLNEESMPTPEEIFGERINFDTPLVVCYRNQGSVIVTAHALGMGLYRKEGLVQLPSSHDVWKAIGYFSDEEVRDGYEATLYRTKETSPDFLNVDPNELIRFSEHKNATEMYQELLLSIERDIIYEQLSPKDIMIIDMDTYSYADNHNRLMMYKRSINNEREKNHEQGYEIKTHVAGAASPEDFFRENSIVYSSVRRAKGNETFMVYIVNAQKCINSLQKRADRNALFTALTRSKGWVSVLGYGEDMKKLCEEFSIIKQHDFKLFFEHYPTKEEQERIYLNNKDAGYGEIRTIDKTRALIERLAQGDNNMKVQLMKQLFNADTNELIELLRETEDG